MSFKPTKRDLQKTAICPVGMHLFTLVAVDKEYMNAKGTKIQRADFETKEGYLIPVFFNDKMIDYILKFVQAADNIKFNMEDELPEINLPDYIGKQVAGSVDHNKDDSGKVMANITEFFIADAVPF